MTRTELVAIATAVQSGRPKSHVEAAQALAEGYLVLANEYIDLLQEVERLRAASTASCPTTSTEPPSSSTPG